MNLFKSNKYGCEISLKIDNGGGFCNLSTVNVANIESQKDLNERVAAAAFIGTLQAGYLDFHFLRHGWQKTAQDEALIGVSMTGIASGEVLKYDIKKAADVVKRENKRIADLIGIKKAKRCTCIKPEGTASLVAGCASGIHAYHAPYYIRRMRLNKDESIFKYLNDKLPKDFIEDDVFSPNTTAVLSLPIKSPDDAIFRDEGELELLRRVKRFQLDWINPGHRSGSNKNNVSVTVSIKNENWEKVGEWMWENRENYTGISVLPYDGGSYQQAPFEDITKEEYERLIFLLKDINIDLTQIIEDMDKTDLQGEAACAGGSCEISSI